MVTETRMEDRRKGKIHVWEEQEKKLEKHQGLWIILQKPKADRDYLNVGNAVAGWWALSSVQNSPSRGRGLVGHLTLENGNKWWSAKGTTTKCPGPSQESAAPCMRQKSRGSNLTLTPKCGKARLHRLKGPNGNIWSEPRWLDRLSLWGRDWSWLAWIAILVHIEEWRVRKWGGPSCKSCSVSFSFSSL